MEVQYFNAMFIQFYVLAWNQIKFSPEITQHLLIMF